MSESLSIQKEDLHQQIQIMLEPLLHKIKLLEQTVNELKSEGLIMTKEKALLVVKNELVKFKARGTKEIDVIDINKMTHLPIHQISEIMDSLEKDGVVKAV